VLDSLHEAHTVYHTLSSLIYSLGIPISRIGAFPDRRRAIDDHHNLEKELAPPLLPHVQHELCLLWILGVDIERSANNFSRSFEKEKPQEM
jgi:hypothetical protein